MLPAPGCWLGAPLSLEADCRTRRFALQDFCPCAGERLRWVSRAIRVPCMQLLRALLRRFPASTATLSCASLLYRVTDQHLRTTQSEALQIHRVTAQEVSLKAEGREAPGQLIATLPEE